MLALPTFWIVWWVKAEEVHYLLLFWLSQRHDHMPTYVPVPDKADSVRSDLAGSVPQVWQLLFFTFQLDWRLHVALPATESGDEVFYNV